MAFFFKRKADDHENGEPAWTSLDHGESSPEVLPLLSLALTLLEALKEQAISAKAKETTRFHDEIAFLSNLLLGGIPRAKDLAEARERLARASQVHAKWQQKAIDDMNAELTGASSELVDSLAEVIEIQAQVAAQTQQAAQRLQRAAEASFDPVLQAEAQNLAESARHQQERLDIIDHEYKRAIRYVRRRSEASLNSGNLDPATGLHNRSNLEIQFEGLQKEADADITLGVVEFQDFAALRHRLGPEETAKLLKSIGQSVALDLPPDVVAGRTEHDVLVFLTTSPQTSLQALLDQVKTSLNQLPGLDPAISTTAFESGDTFSLMLERALWQVYQANQLNRKPKSA